MEYKDKEMERRNDTLSRRCNYVSTPISFVFHSIRGVIVITLYARCARVQIIIISGRSQGAWSALGENGNAIAPRDYLLSRRCISLLRETEEELRFANNTRNRSCHCRRYNGAMKIPSSPADCTRRRFSALLLYLSGPDTTDGERTLLSAET